MTIQTFPITDLIPGLIEARGALDFDQRSYVSQPDTSAQTASSSKEPSEKNPSVKSLKKEVTRQGLSPRRLPDWTRMQVPQVMDVIVRMPSGVRLRFNTTATRIGLEFLATNLVNAGKERRQIVFNLELSTKAASTPLVVASDKGNAIHLDPAKPGKFDLVRGEADTVWFESLPEGDKCCELWLPHNAFIELRALHLNEDAVLTAPEGDERPRWLHYGSSISHCMEADEPAHTWPAVAARKAHANLQSLGFGGQCHLDQFVARTIRDSDADVVTIKVGINVINLDSMRERVFVSALHGFIDTIREGKPDTPIVLVSPIYCPSAEHVPGPTFPDSDGKFVTFVGHEKLREGCLTLARARTLINDLVKQRGKAGDKHLSYLDGLTLFSADDAGDLPDDLHPNAAGYVRMGERFAPTLAAALASVT